MTRRELNAYVAGFGSNHMLFEQLGLKHEIADELLARLMISLSVNPEDAGDIQGEVRVLLGLDPAASNPNAS